MHTFSKYVFATFIFSGAFFMIDARMALAYTPVNIPAIISDNGRSFNVTVIAVANSSGSPSENEGSQVSHQGANPYIDGVINGFYDTDPINPAPTNLPDFAFPFVPAGATTSINVLIESVLFSNIDSITINGQVFFPSQIIAQNPSFQNVALYVVMTPPAGMSVVQGQTGARFQGVEQMVSVQTPGAGFYASDLESFDIDGDGSWEMIFPSGNQLNVLTTNGTQKAGFPLTFSTTNFYGVSVGDINPSSPGVEMVVVYLDNSIGTYKVAAVRPDGSILFSTQIGSPLPNSITYDEKPLKIADANRDGVFDVVWVGGENPGAVISVDAIDGNGNHLPGYPVANVVTGAIPPFGVTSPDYAVANVDGDSNLEAVIVARVGTALLPVDYSVTIFDLLTRTVEGTFNPASSSVAFNNSLLLFNADIDPQLEIAFVSGTTGNIEVFNNNGSPVPGWPRPWSLSIGVPNLFAGDLDGDGINELGAAATGPSIVIFNNNGTPWNINTAVGGGLLLNRGKIIDIDLDGTNEVVIDDVLPIGSSSFFYQAGSCVGPGSALCQNTNGPIALQYPFAPTPYLSFSILGSTIGDVDGDGVWEIAMLRSPFVGSSIQFSELIVFKIAYYSGGVPSVGMQNRSSHVNERNTNAVQ